MTSDFQLKDAFSSHNDEYTRNRKEWKRYVDKQHPRWHKVDILERADFEIIERCITRDFFGNYTEQRYWRFINTYAQRLNDEVKTGYILPESEHLHRWQTDSYYLKCIDNSLYHKPTYEAFWFDSYRYTGQVAAFFDLGSNLYQSLLIRTRKQDRKYIGALLITFSKTRTNDFHCPKIHSVIQDGEYKK